MEGDLKMSTNLLKYNSLERPNFLVKVPEIVIDYLILHELCHLKIKEHSHHFWDLIHKFMSDYQEQVEWLGINGSRLVSY